MDDRRRVRAARADAASRAAREGGSTRPRGGGAGARRGSTSSPFAERRLGTLSGGEKQRVVVARALAQEARIVLLDEPTAALDIGHQQQALELLDGLRASPDLTLVAAMHDLTLAAQYADRMVLLDAGRVVADGPPHEVLTEDAHRDALRRGDPRRAASAAASPSCRAGALAFQYLDGLGIRSRDERPLRERMSLSSCSSVLEREQAHARVSSKRFAPEAPGAVELRRRRTVTRASYTLERRPGSSRAR